MTLVAGLGLALVLVLLDMTHPLMMMDDSEMVRW